MNILLRYRPEIIAFFSGAGVMIFEVLGSRIVGPYIGTSLFVWTSLIAIILFALSIGHYYGGKLSDSRADLRLISLLLILSTVSILILLISKDFLLLFFSTQIPDVRFSSIVIALFLFSPTSFLLGMLSPIVTKIRLTHIETSGQVVGKIGSIGTIGSIIGTLAAGFFLIPFFGVTQLLIFLGFGFLGLSLLCETKKYILLQLSIFILLSVMFSLFLTQKTNDGENNIFTYDTSYSHITISERDDEITQKTVKDLRIDNITHAGMFLEDNNLVYQYTKFYHLFNVLLPNAKDIVLFGGAAYSFPKSFLDTYSEKNLDVVEIDPKITEIARKHFRLQNNPHLNIYHQDARVFLNTTEKKYDAILGDAFGSFLSIPYQLTTLEVAKKKYELLNDNGVVILNIIGSLEGEKAKFLEAEYKTYSQVFPEVFVIPVYSENTSVSQNIMLVAAKNPETLVFQSEYSLYTDFLSKRRYLNIPSDTRILTDNFAPVDYYVSSMHQ